MNSKKIALIAMFTAITVALVISPIKFPAPYAPFLVYQIWEIPIVTAFLLFGPTGAITITVLNTIILMGVFPGPLPAGPLYNLAAILSMLMGIYLVQRFVAERFRKRRETMITVASTILGIVARVGIMSIVNWVCLPLPYPFGYNIPAVAVTPILPVIGFFNATLALYTIPAGYFLAGVIGHSLKTSVIKREQQTAQSEGSKEKK